VNTILAVYRYSINSFLGSFHFEPPLLSLMSQEAHTGSFDRTNSHDAAHHFFMESHRIATEAQFIIDSLPNAEIPAVERIVRQLDSIRTILLSLNDPATTPDETEQLLQFVQYLLTPLKSFLATPPPPANSNVPREFPDTRGRSRYILDLDHAHELHQLGNTWEDIADAMGVTRQTLYNHMAHAGRSTSRKAWSDITDDDLDEKVAEISLAHPFVGSAIVQGHLEGQGVHIPRLRVQESLQRVDRIGVLVR
jgi:hypothetical protein